MLHLRFFVNFFWFYAILQILYVKKIPCQVVSIMYTPLIIIEQIPIICSNKSGRGLPRPDQHPFFQILYCLFLPSFNILKINFRGSIVHGFYLPHPPRPSPDTVITSTWDDHKKPVCSTRTTSSRNSIPFGIQTVIPWSLSFSKPSSTGGLPLSTSAAFRAAQPPPSLVTIM